MAGHPRRAGVGAVRKAGAFTSRLLPSRPEAQSMSDPATTTSSAAQQTPKADIGVTGLAVMGSNLARNFARNGFVTAVHNRTQAKTAALVEQFGDEGTFVASASTEEFVASLATPRKIIIMVKAGA